jgi:hypothetical protein
MEGKPKTLGEFGRSCGREVYAIREVPGHVLEVRNLWEELDRCDAPREDEIFLRLSEIGALAEV